MPHITTVLGNEVGIQFQGVQDKSSSTGQYPVVGLFIGQFRRGRLDKPMTIHKGNIKAILGHEPENPDYAAVSDALAAGLPSVQVVRVSNTKPYISCDGASSYQVFHNSNSNIAQEIEVNGVLYKFNNLSEMKEFFNGDPQEHYLAVFSYQSGYTYFNNNSESNPIRIRYKQTPQNTIHKNDENDADQIYFDEANNEFIFCLNVAES